MGSESAVASRPQDEPEERYRRRSHRAGPASHPVLRRLFVRILELVLLLFVISSVLFFLVRLTGDPAHVLAGEASTPAVVEEIRRQYGLNDSLIVQYRRFLENALLLRFGDSLAAGLPALDLVLDRVPTTLLLAASAIAVGVAISVPAGAWLGARTERLDGRVGNAVVFAAQGIPGYVVALILIQLLAVELRLVPSIAGTGWRSWVLPILTLASFVVPRVTRVIGVNVRDAMHEDYIRTARATGSSPASVLWHGAIPNSLLGATALIGTQFAYLLSGAVITEVIFSVAGIGQLLVTSVNTLDFPVVQASVFVVTVLVFTVNAAFEALFAVVDPRIRRGQA